jgi:hypothetical protein
MGFFGVVVGVIAVLFRILCSNESATGTADMVTPPSQSVIENNLPGSADKYWTEERMRAAKPRTPVRELPSGR